MTMGELKKDEMRMDERMRNWCRDCVTSLLRRFSLGTRSRLERAKGERRKTKEKRGSLKEARLKLAFGKLKPIP